MWFYLFICLVVRSFIHSFIHSFICLCNGSSYVFRQCPVCREVLVAESSCLEAVSQATPPLGCYVVETEVVRIAPDIRAWQKEMAILLEHQRQKGGVIDLSAKDEVIDETWVRWRARRRRAREEGTKCGGNEGTKRGNKEGTKIKGEGTK